MNSKKEITWEGKKWIIDYQDRTIYQEIKTPDLPVRGRFGNFPFKKFNNALYFTTSDNFYKIVGEDVLNVSKEEYDKQQKYREIDKNSPITKRTITNYVVAVIVDEILKKRYDLTVSTPVKNSNVVTVISHKFTPIISNNINTLTASVLNVLPAYIDTTKIKNEIHAAYQKITENNDKFCDNLLELIYINDQDRFDYIAEEIKKSRETQSKINEIKDDNHKQEQKPNKLI